MPRTIRANLHTPTTNLNESKRMATVPDLVQSCIVQFSSLIASDGLTKHILEVPLQAWRDELGRLRVWAGNIAQGTGQSSLDYRLRDASHIKDQILSLLGRVKELLLDLTEVLEEDADVEKQYPYAGAEGHGDYPENDDSITEVQQIHQGLLETITQLYQMSMMIRQPAHHDRLSGTRRVDAEPFVFWAGKHVSSKYPHADEVVINRLSFMMARQKAILKFRERHHAKRSQGIDPESMEWTMPPGTIVNNAYKEPNQPHDVASDSGASETSYSGTLFEGVDGETRTPPMPEKGRGKSPFRCPYCFYTITVRDEQAWLQHILSDLMPYVCVFPECSTPNRLYGSCQQWYAHIQEMHPIADTSYQCAICKHTHLPSVGFQQHVARHLQEVALFYLPQVTMFDPKARQEEGAQGANSEQRWRLKANLTKGKSMTGEMEDEEKSTKKTSWEDLRNPYSETPEQIALREAAVEEWKLEQERMEHKEQENENILEKKKKERREIEKEKEKTTWTKVSDLGNYMELHPSSHTGYTGDTGGTDVDVL
jgi:DNA-directed RNA polymerase subunit RPC12/RpoP